MFGNLSVKFFLPATPSDRNSLLTTFRSATCSFTLFTNAACRGLFSVAVLTNSITDIACLAFTAVTKSSYNFSHSALGGTSAHSQYAGSPARADELLLVCFPLDSKELSRSTILKLSYTVKELTKLIELITLYFS